jgi:hypothetical protein
MKSTSFSLPEKAGAAFIGEKPEMEVCLCFPGALLVRPTLPSDLKTLRDIGHLALASASTSQRSRLMTVR